MYGTTLNIEKEPFLELKYINGTYVNLTIDERVCYEGIQYYVKDILNLVRIPAHASSDKYQIDTEFLEWTP
jgi:hypothetical protein